MGTSLTGLTPATTYDALIKVGDNGPLSATAKILSDGLGNDSVLALSTGNVGVGTTTITTISGTNPVLTIGGTSISGGLVLQRSGTDKARLYESGDLFIHQGMSSVGHSFYVNASTEAMRITSAGNIGIGTSTPDNTLDLGSPSQGRGLTFDNYSNLFSSYSAGDLVLSNNFYGSTSSDTYLTSLTATFGAAGMRISATSGASTGGQIQFFANAAAAKTAGTAFTPTEICRVTPNGLTFNGDTAAANALDDYEEGTWTPTFTGSTTNPTITYAVQSGFYTKIGRQVTITLEIGTTANTGGVGSVEVSGLPFTVGIRVYNCVATYNINNSVTNPMGIFAEVNAGGTKLDFLATGDNTTWTAVNWTDATNAVIYINGSFTYFV